MLYLTLGNVGFNFISKSVMIFLLLFLRDENSHLRWERSFYLFDVALVCSIEVIDHTTKWQFYLFIFHPFLSILYPGELNEGKSA